MRGREALIGESEQLTGTFPLARFSPRLCVGRLTQYRKNTAAIAVSSRLCAPGGCRAGLTTPAHTLRVPGCRCPLRGIRPTPRAFLSLFNSAVKSAKARPWVNDREPLKIDQGPSSGERFVLFLWASQWPAQRMWVREDAGCIGAGVLLRLDLLLSSLTLPSPASPFICVFPSLNPCLYPNIMKGLQSPLLFPSN